MSSDPYVNGTMEHDMSATSDAVTGEGPFHGSWKINPANMALTGGGWWEGISSLGNRDFHEPSVVYLSQFLCSGFL